jgi:hypothetical protein
VSTGSSVPRLEYEPSREDSTAGGGRTASSRVQGSMRGSASTGGGQLSTGSRPAATGVPHFTGLTRAAPQRLSRLWKNSQSCFHAHGNSGSAARDPRGKMNGSVLRECRGWSAPRVQLELRRLALEMPAELRWAWSETVQTWDGTLAGLGTGHLRDPGRDNFV